MTSEFVMRPIYDSLLHGTAETPIGIYHLHLVTAEQLCRLHYSPGSINAVKARLKTLVDQGYVQADTIPSKQLRSPYYYTLGSKGMKYLEGLDLERRPAWRARKEVEKGALFVEHTLELNDVLISAALLHRADPRYHLERFLHERALRRQPYKATWRQGGQSQTFTIIPDAFLDLRLRLPTGRFRRWPLLLEHDRGTEGQQHFKQRIRAYIMLFKSEAYREFFGVQVISVLFTTFLGADRVEEMRLWTRQELETSHEPVEIGTLFFFGALKRPISPAETWLGPVWRLPYDEDPEPQPLVGDLAS
jgi:hypothetical protein